MLSLAACVKSVFISSIDLAATIYNTGQARRRQSHYGSALSHCQA